MRILILIQLLAGFVLAFLGVIIMFHMYEVWLGLGITLVGFYAVIRAVHRDNITVKREIHYFINEEGQWICTMNGTEDDSVYDTLDGCGYKLQYGDPAKDFNEDGYHIETLKENE